MNIPDPAAQPAGHPLTVTDLAMSLPPDVRKRLLSVHAAAVPALAYTGNPNAGSQIGHLLKELFEHPKQVSSQFKFDVATRGWAAEAWRVRFVSARLDREDANAIAALCWTWFSQSMLHTKSEYTSGRIRHVMSSPWAAGYALDVARSGAGGGRPLTATEFAYVMLAWLYQVGPAKDDVMAANLGPEHDTLVQHVRWWAQWNGVYGGVPLVAVCHNAIVADEGGTTYEQIVQDRQQMAERKAAKADRRSRRPRWLGGSR